MIQKIKKGGLLISVVGLLLIVVACGKGNEDGLDIYREFVSGVEMSNTANPIVVLDTVRGMIAIEVYEDKTPITAINFIQLVEEGFYDGLKFHAVKKDYSVQTGDPTVVGTGGADIKPIKLEIHPDLSHNEKGIVGMARVNDVLDSATSQFYIMLTEDLTADKKYAIFGKVIKGIDELDEIKQFDKINRAVKL